MVHPRAEQEWPIIAVRLTQQIDLQMHAASAISHGSRPAGRRRLLDQQLHRLFILYSCSHGSGALHSSFMHDACLTDVSNSIDLQQPAAKLARTRDQLTRRSTHRPVDLLAAAPLSADHANATHQPHMHAPTERIYYTFQPQHFSVSPISISANRMII